MKIKGGGRKKSASSSTEVVVGSIQDAMDGGEVVHGGDSDYANVNGSNNPINGGEPSTSHLSETHQEQNLEEPEDDGEGDEEDEQDGDEAGFSAQRTNLDDGFYEIEAIRRKRVRKVFSFSIFLVFWSSDFFVCSLTFCLFGLRE